MSRAPLMRPAARSAAVRPHSSSSSPARASCSRAPRPVSGASSCSAYIFFVSLPRPNGRQSCLVAGCCSQDHWEHGRGWERLWKQEYRAFSDACAIVPTVPTFPHARVMRSRSRACSPLFTSLGTWEPFSIVFAVQRLALFPSLFPAPLRVGTWEQSEALGPRSDRSFGGSNIIRAGYRLLQRPSGDARRNFRAPIAAGRGPSRAHLALELGRIRSCSTWSQRNGGNPPFLSADRAHVGTVMLEGLRQAADLTAFLGQRPKLGRLRVVALGEPAAGAIARPSARELGCDRPGEGPGAPNRAPSSPAMLSLHAGGNWIETRSVPIAAAQACPFYDGDMPTVCENAQTDDWQRGPGGARFSIDREFAGRRHNRRAGKRAGVSRFPASSRRPHEAREFAKAAADFRGRQVSFGMSANQTAKGIVNG